MTIRMTKAFSEAALAFIGLWLLSGGLWKNGKHYNALFKNFKMTIWITMAFFITKACCWKNGRCQSTVKSVLFCHPPPDGCFETKLIIELSDSLSSSRLL